MQCMSCGHENSDDARFCSQCGTRLALTCPNCSTENQPGSRFCSQCGTGLTAAAHGATTAATAAAQAQADEDLARYIPEELLRRIRAAQAGGVMRGERRTVTMLFADIQGSTAAAERMDPEDWAEIINGAFAHLIAPVYRYEGTLARLQGDAILAFFGAPIAHEDDPVRAIRAGLEIVAAIDRYRDEVHARTGIPVAVRVGINTGLVVVGEVGSDLRVEYTALGDAINVAARMEQTAEPGTVQVTEHTANLVGDMFILSDIGGVEVKGKTEPVRAYRVEAVSAPSDADSDDTPLVGRDAELATLESAIGQVAEGLGTICALLGDAGIGKSRLLATARHNLASAKDVAARWSDPAGDIAWLEGHCRSFDATVPYALFSDMLLRWWGVEGEQIDGAWDVVSAAVEQATGAADHDTASFLTTVIGAPVPDEHAVLVSTLATPVLHQRTTEAIARYLEAEAVRRPVLLVLDDVHWGDAISLALTERLMASGDSAALGLLIASRPQRDGPSWRLLESAARDHGHRYSAVQLEALGEEATRTLVASLLGGQAAERLSAQVVDRAGGNPFFVEELVRSLDAGGDVDKADGSVPATLTGLLTARLDQLGEREREVAQVASVVGPEFEPRAVGALLDDERALSETLTGLVRSGVILERRRVPAPLYAFRHVLIQETAYSTTLLRTRRELHERLAVFLEQSQPDAVNDIGRHLLAAGASDRAFPYLVKAAQRATRKMALADAIALFTTALDAVPADAVEDLVVQAHDGLGEAYGLIPDLPKVESIYQQLMDYARVSQHPSVEALALNRLALATATHTGDFAKAEGYLSEARRVAESCGDEIGLAEYHMGACMLASMQGQLDRALGHDEETMRLGTSQGSERIRVLGLIRRTLNLISTNRFEEAAAAMDEAIRAADKVGDQESSVTLRTIATADLALAAGDPRRALALMDEGVPQLERFASFNASPAQAEASAIALELGDLEGAIARSSHARRTAAAGGQTFAAGMAAAVLTRCYAVCGVTAQIDALRAEALESLAGPMGDFLASSTWAHLGWANVAMAAFDTAGEDFALGLEVSSTKRFFERPSLLLGTAMVALARGDVAAARSLFDQAQVYVTEAGFGFYEARLAYTGGLVAAHAGDLAAAAASLDRADQIAASRGQLLVRRDVALARYDLARRAGDEAQAQAQARQAGELSQVIASTIADQTLRESFLQRSAELVRDAPTVRGS